MDRYRPTQNHPVAVPTTIFYKCVGGHHSRHTSTSGFPPQADMGGLSWRFSQHAFTVTTECPTTHVGMHATHVWRRSSSSEHDYINSRLRLTGFQSVRFVSGSSWGSRPNFIVAYIFNATVIQPSSTTTPVCTLFRVTVLGSCICARTVFTHLVDSI